MIRVSADAAPLFFVRQFKSLHHTKLQWERYKLNAMFLPRIGGATSKLAVLAFMGPDDGPDVLGHRARCGLFTQQLFRDHSPSGNIYNG